ncbi:MAG: hypothetical protein QN173_06320 [Armatimonadota bacterium]|nr:hypothetical protein [Armatimonadota bacterium]MDR7401805.1 hypothetical protein [Armatimonadota bacterium]MDR7403107.1 hypothetical protein [Armatimonadota bacterium]MDR7436190.1 hypothetical protein [Armatimonadota bacterium]MDR7471429.1 hypothetical protein [Armatimonadota bacterium]
MVRVVLPAADPVSRTARVRLRLTSPPPGVLPGTSVRGEVVVERRTGVLLVPSSALREGAATEVVVVRDGRAQIRRVVVGLRHDHLVQVLYGLREGEQVITLGPEQIGDGQPVVVVTP